MEFISQAFMDGDGKRNSYVIASQNQVEIPGKG